jgi:ubiquitin C-terminal hydrolase
MQSGLHNIGASCWLNSSIQVLYSLIPIGLAMSAMLKSEEYINKIDLYVAVKPGCKKKLATEIKTKGNTWNGTKS